MGELQTKEVSLKQWQTEHKKVIDNFLQFLNTNSSDYILKGDTALMECYNLVRFSEDIELNSNNKNYIPKAIKEFCDKNNYTYKMTKDTETIKQYVIHYNEIKPLKIEISYRQKEYEPEKYTTINGINVYNIEELAILKEQAYMRHDLMKDLYDIVFICNNYWDELSSPVKSMIRYGFEQKGFEQADYLMQTQQDALIDNHKLSEDVLTVFDKLGIIDERQVTHSE